MHFYSFSDKSKIIKQQNSAEIVSYLLENGADKEIRVSRVFKSFAYCSSIVALLFFPFFFSFA
jgi:hypothetical protein